jgi:hypothetical protein
MDTQGQPKLIQCKKMKTLRKYKPMPISVQINVSLGKVRVGFKE